MNRKNERRREIQLVREHAIAAARNGKSIHSCPYKYCDEIQWKEAYRREKDQIEEEARQETLAEIKDTLSLEERVERLEEMVQRLLEAADA